MTYELRRVEEAKADTERAEVELRDAIFAAVRAGFSQAEVGRAAGLTRGRIHQIIQRVAEREQ